jgi:hypothetical protein
VNAQPEEFRLEIPDAEIADLRAPAKDALLSQSTARRRVRSFTFQEVAGAIGHYAIRDFGVVHRQP